MKVIFIRIHFPSPLAKVVTPGTDRGSAAGVGFLTLREHFSKLTGFPASRIL